MTGGLISGVVLHQDAGNSTFVDAELALTYYPRNFAGGALTPGLVVDAGGEFAPNRGRLTVASKLGILYLLSLEAGIAVRDDGDTAAIGASGRVRLNIPVARLIYVSPYARRSVFRDGGDDTEFGVGLKMMLWGNSSKLEGALNR